MLKCEKKNSAIEHSNENDPEMFTVYSFDLTRRFKHCLNHAAESEQRGRRVEIIRH